MLRISLVMSAILLIAVGAAAGTRKKHVADTFACIADKFTLSSFETGSASVSPDGKSRLELRPDYSVHLLSYGNEVVFDGCGFTASLEVAWSSDSKRLSMQCGHNAYNDFTVAIITLQGDKSRESDLPSRVLKDFTALHSCPERGENNLFFLAWTQDSRKAFLVSEVSPTGDCGKEAGRFAGYLVDVESGQVLKRFGEKETTLIENKCRASGVLNMPQKRRSTK